MAASKKRARLPGGVKRERNAANMQQNRGMAVLRRAPALIMKRAPAVDPDALFTLKRIIMAVLKKDEARKKREQEEAGGIEALTHDDDVILVENVPDAGSKQARPPHAAAHDADLTLSSIDDFEMTNEPSSDVDVDVCVVAEVENAAGATAAVTAQKEKPYSCTKCSRTFFKQVTLDNHIMFDHDFDAGQTTIMEELGIPLDTQLWICRNCCLAFATAESKKEHASQHSDAVFTCETCSGCAYSEEEMEKHTEMAEEEAIEYICGECKLSFYKETSLHEHSKLKHGTHLFYFCKSCEHGTTNGADAYAHFMLDAECPLGFAKPRKHLEDTKPEDAAWRAIGVCPASQLHYQPPTEVEHHKEQVLARNPDRFVTPSLCNHRSMLAASEEAIITCDTCRCLENYETRAAMDTFAKGTFNMKTRKVEGRMPLAAVRAAYKARKTGGGGGAVATVAGAAVASQSSTSV